MLADCVQTHPDPEPFASASDGSLVKVIDYGVARITPDGYGHRVAAVSSNTCRRLFIIAIP
jgi:hypothetical protein